MINKFLAILALLLGGAMTVAQAAPATQHHEFDLGNDPDGYDRSVNLIHHGGFSDTFDFTLTEPADAYGAGSYTTQKTRIGTTFDISDFTLSLFRAGLASTLLSAAEGRNFAILDNYELGAGDYYYTVSGNVLGNRPGKYDFRVDVLPVSEPEPYALMLAGLGLLGVAARRKAKAQA